MKERRVFRWFVGILAGIMLFTGVQASPVQAAKKISYNKAVMMYNNKMSWWARRNSRFTITYDLRFCPVWTSFNDKGKRIPARSFYYGSLRYVIRDVSGDGIPEAFFYSNKYRAMVVLTIYKNKVKLLGTFRVTDFYPSPVRYNRNNRSFILETMVTGRSSTVCRFQIKNGRLYRKAMLSKYIAPMERDGRDHSSYYINFNKRSVSKRTYNNYYRKYFRYTNRYTWGP
ncbi:MAG TPA: hypothetical protein IAA26_11320 [Candidatus Blautia faecipullorum]|nr:hypothetical protein [Candidatus Blautia faecipullorum]